MLNGGYEDDEDYGEEVVYTGHGGNDPATRKQVADQSLKVGNRALARSCDDGLPVRVVRGPGERSRFRCPTGLRYDGCYRVDHYWADTGRSGFKIWRFRLIRDDPAPPPWAEQRAPSEPVSRAESTIQRLVRNTEHTRQIKELYDYTCQICGLRLETRAGPYAEGVHIRPLGRPHDGPDELENLLCLCPNCHLLLDRGGLTIDRELGVHDILDREAPRRLTMHPRHQLNPAHLAYHWRLFRWTRDEGTGRQ